MAASATEYPHPYIPRDLKLDGYVPNVLPQSTLAGVYLGISLAVVSVVWILSGRSARALKLDRLLMCWWAFTGLTHIILEGYFVFSPEFYKNTSYLDEVWKLYSYADSRYAARGSDVVSIEGITAVFEGPLCLLLIYAIASRKSYSHILQFAVSLGQLYGTILYYITAFLDGDNFAASGFYYYAYYVMANVWWIIIPSLIMMHCWNEICSAMEASLNKKKKTKNP